MKNRFKSKPYWVKSGILGGTAGFILFICGLIEWLVYLTGASGIPILEILAVPYIAVATFLYFTFCYECTKTYEIMTMMIAGSVTITVSAGIGIFIGWGIKKLKPEREIG